MSRLFGPAPRLRTRTRRHRDGSVDSLQEVLLPGPPPGLVALERAYFRWVPAISADFAAPRWPEGPGGPLRIEVAPLGLALIRMAPPAEEPGRRRARAVLGGLLAHGGGELSFELEPGPRGTLLRVALRGFRPRMPAWLYWATQRPLHERSSLAFLRQVARARGARPWSHRP